MLKKVDLTNPNYLHWFIALVVIIFPFIANDFIYLANRKNPNVIWPVDYLTKVWALGFSYYFFGKDGYRLRSSLKPIESVNKAIDYIAMPLVLYGINFCAYYAGKGFFKLSRNYIFPAYESLWFRTFDLTVGLFLVAFVEELIFRRYLYSFIASLTKKNWLAIILQAFIFGGIHYSSGTANVFSATIFGLFAGLFYHRKKDLIPLIWGHYFVNLMVFS